MSTKIKRLLCACMVGLMAAVIVPSMVPEMSYVAEVQAAAKVAAPKLVSAKASGKNKVIVKWKKVNKVSGYRIYRKEKGGSWQGLKNVSGSNTLQYADASAKSGVQYTYTVRAYKTSKGKRTWSKYDKKGVTAIAGLNYLKLNKTSMTMYVGGSETLKINGTQLNPTWKSSNTKVIQVSKNGKVTAKKTGNATVTATLGGKKFSCKITVKKMAVSNKMKESYTKLKEVIQRRGTLDDDGNYTVLVDYGNYGLSITYDREYDSIDVLYIDVLDENTIFTTMVSFNRAKYDTALVTFNYFRNEKIYTTYADISASKHMKSSNYTFKYPSNNKTANDFFQTKSNKYLKVGLDEFENWLRRETGLTMEDIGFDAY